MINISASSLKMSKYCKRLPFLMKRLNNFPYLSYLEKDIQQSEKIREIDCQVNIALTEVEKKRISEEEYISTISGILEEISLPSYFPLSNYLKYQARRYSLRAKDENIELVTTFPVMMSQTMGIKLNKEIVLRGRPYLVTNGLNGSLIVEDLRYKNTPWNSFDVNEVLLETYCLILQKQGFNVNGFMFTLLGEGKSIYKQVNGTLNEKICKSIQKFLKTDIEKIMDEKLFHLEHNRCQWCKYHPFCRYYQKKIG